MKTKLGKKHMPERKLFIESECKRKTCCSDGTFRLMLFNRINYTCILVFIKIGNIVFIGNSPALFTSVSGNKTPSLTEIYDIKLTVCSTALALYGT